MEWKLEWSFDGWVVAVTMSRGAATLELQLFEDACAESCTNVRKTPCSTFATRLMHRGTSFTINHHARMREQMPDDVAIAELHWKVSATVATLRVSSLRPTLRLVSVFGRLSR